MNALRLWGFSVLLCGSGFLATPAYGDGLLGSELGWQYYGGGGAYNPDPANGSVTSGTFTDNGGIGGTFIDQGTLSVFNILSNDTSITFDYSPNETTGPWSSNSPESLPPTIYNGIAINLLSGGGFADVAIDPATNMSGFVASDLSFTNNQIEVNWAGLPFTNSTIVTLDVDYSVIPTPEPATGFLAAAVLLITMVTRRLNWLTGQLLDHRRR